MRTDKPALPKGSADKALTDLYQGIGGMPVCRRLSERFHDRIAGDPVLRRMFPKDLARTTEHIALFLAERLGGPADYSAKRGKQSLYCRHAHLPIGSDEAERWLGHMFAAMDEVGFSVRARGALRDYFRTTAAFLADPLLPHYHLPLDQLRVLLETNHGLVTPSDGRRSLLSAAAVEWDVLRVRVLLEYGADVNAKDQLGHDPLYHAASTHAPDRETDGHAVVVLLIQHGANVNVRSGPGRLTALHASARRGSVSIAEALLAEGAEVEAKGTKGETPLRRAVNCGHERMVRLLLAYGAHPLSMDSRGLTVIDAARNEQIRDVLREAVER